jgi:hypothetical protein
MTHPPHSQYPSGIVVSDADMAAINIKRAEFHGDWNYTISPNDHPQTISPNDHPQIAR